ncbi:hypothetical protein BJX61DRAFT_87752 [Aspergillus egyptiacus]|nr:hypothetical protein BJX61DRAFT_87752 [Aspergillus egyptiacus]
MDSRIDTAVTVEELPAPLPLDTEPRPAGLVEAAAAAVNTIAREIAPPPSDPQQDQTPDNPSHDQETEVETRQSESPETEAPEPEPQETSTDPESAEEHAYWVEEEEDTSAPDEAEMKEIESQADGDYSALEYNYWEKNFYPSLDDPEYRPIEKARLTWKIKGVRGTKENPNRAKIMRSPPAYIGGYWWTIKFFPRGNNVGSLSVYIECSSTPPKPDSTLPETEFKVLRGPADTELDIDSPDLHMKFAKTEDTEGWNETFKSLYTAAASQSDTASPGSWRVSAQIGVIIYNPEEPRTGWMQSSCHQFNPHNLDWGWTNFHGPWDQIHRRQQGQRQALLRNDTLCFDAYIRIFDDPTKSLWWHPSDSEPTWDSLALTGYRPLGDSVINHSADVAGLATWLHIAPFCKIIQSVNVHEHLKNCDVKPKPLCDALQKFLWQLRQRDQSLQYVDTDAITSILRNLHEGSSDVCEFWERLRRSLELEIAGTPAAEQLAQLFDSPSLNTLSAGALLEPVHTIPKDHNSRIYVPADQAKSTSEAFSSYLSAKPGKWVLPPVLHLELGRQTLDKAARQWRLLYNRVDLDEELDLSPWLLNDQCGKYVLYGYIVHRGRRTSGKFFSILRPGGPGTKWLAFDDGSDNRVECLTSKTALGPHLGLDLSQTPDHKTGHDVAVAVIYVRSDVVKDFLPGPQGPWEVSEDLKTYYETGQICHLKKTDGKAEDEDIQVEVYSLEKYDQLGSLFDTYDLMSQAKAANSVMYLSVPRSTNLTDVRKKIALWAATTAEKDVSPEHIRLWQIGHSRDRFGPTLELTRISNLAATLDLPQNSVRYWVQVMSDGDAKYFALKDPEPTVAINSKPEEAVVERASSETSEVVQEVPATLGAEPGSSSHTSQDALNSEVTEPTAPATEQTSTIESNSESVTPTETSVEDSTQATVGYLQNEATEDLARLDSASNPDTNAVVPAPSQERDPGQPSSTDNHTVSSSTNADPMTPPEPQLYASDDQTEPNADDIESATPAEPEVALPVEHLYYFIQLFDIESQSLRTVGSFLSQRDETIKTAIRKHLEWPATKDFQVWQRVDGTTITTLASAEVFESHIPDGTCFIVGDKLNKDKRAKLNEAGLFANPDHLVSYLWAKSRNHPTRAFTGTKTLDATFTSDYYSGDFMKGYFHGKGKHIADSAATYTGDFVLGKRHGKGLMEYPTGDTYDGDWFENQCHGQGTFVERKTGNKYVGGYKDGKRHGKGISYWEVADEEMDLCQICFGEEQDALFYDCGHVCACVTCARQVDICPICRKNVLSVVKIYRT